MITVKKEQVELVNEILNKKEWNYTKKSLLDTHIKGLNKDDSSVGKWVNFEGLDATPMNEISYDELLAILLDEYELELTVEEALEKELTDTLLNLGNPYDRGYYDGLKYAKDLITNNK